MSTYWTYQCRSHSPNVDADDGLNRGAKSLMELKEAFQRGLIPRERYVGNEIEITVEIWGASWPWSFLMQHKECQIRVVSEYGDVAWRDPATGDVVYTTKNGEVRKA